MVEIPQDQPVQVSGRPVQRRDSRVESVLASGYHGFLRAQSDESNQTLRDGDVRGPLDGKVDARHRWAIRSGSSWTARGSVRG